MFDRDRHPSRNHSGDSGHRSHRDGRDRPERHRQGSTGSSSGHHSHRDRKRDEPRRNRLGSWNEQDEWEGEKKGSEDPPPAYTPRVDAPPTSSAKTPPTKQESEPSDGPPSSIVSRIAWSASLLCPLLAATLLLFLITCSSSSLRTDFSVLKISVSAGGFDALYKATEQTADNETSTLASAASLGGMIGRADDTASSGFLTLGVWGWCVSSADSSRSVCSTSSGWYSMKDVVSSAPQSGMKADDFSSVLVHCLILHGLALLSAMLSIVPAILNTWRRYYHNNIQYEAGWIQHGTIVGASLLALGAWVVDKILSHNVKRDLTSNNVKEGPAVTLVGVSSLLLIIAFLISAIPVLYRFVDHQAAYIRKWSTVENASAEAARARREQALADLEAGEGTRRRKGRRRDRWRNRMTRMFVGNEERDRERSRW